MWVADEPLGPYTLQEGVPDIMPFNASTGQYLSGAQQFSVAALPTASGTLPLYVGQRFGSADDGLKCHDYAYYAPYGYNATTGAVLTMEWVNAFNVTIPTFPPAAW